MEAALLTYALKLPDRLRQQGWKVKIRNLERGEAPHVTIIHKTRAWRYGLRDLRFLDVSPNPRDVSAAVISEIETRVERLRREWDIRYPENPIGSAGDDDDGDS